MKEINPGCYQVNIRSHARAPLLSRWSGKLNSSAPQRCRGPIAVNAVERRAESGYQMPQRKTEPWLHLSDADGQKAPLSLQSFSADANCPRRSRSQEGDLTPASLQTVRAQRQRERERERERDSADPVRAPDILHHIHYTNKHLKHSPHNNTGSICGLLLEVSDIYRVSHSRHTLSAIFSFIVLLCDDDESVIYRHIKKLILGFGPGETRDWGMTRWLPTEPVDQ